MSLNGFRQSFTPFSPPFVEQGDGMTPALGDDVRVAPFLPIKRMAQDNQGAWGQFDWPIVIEAGEPIGIVTIDNVKYIVPAAPTAYTLTYGDLDVGKVEDIDNAGAPVTAAGASTATIPAAAPIGLAHQAIRQNPKLSDGTELYNNYDPTYKEVAVRRRHFLVPYFRKGNLAMGTLAEGDLIAVTDPVGNTLSSSARPVLKALTGATFATTPAVSPVITLAKLKYVIGRVIRVWDGLPSTYDMKFVVTPRGSGLSGTETGGVPQELYHAGNVPSNDSGTLPSDISKAGAVLITLEF